MKHIWLLLICFVLLPAGAQELPDSPRPAQPSFGNWNQVESLARGEPISVTTGRSGSTHCEFRGATDTLLYCEPRFFWISGDTHAIPRDRLESVRLDQSRRNRKILIGTIAATGFVLGFTYHRSATSGDETPRIIDAAIFGGTGAFVGLLLSPAVSFLPGKLIYRQPEPVGTTKSAP